jgi:hypothetical protein
VVKSTWNIKKPLLEEAGSSRTSLKQLDESAWNMCSRIMKAVAMMLANTKVYLEL